MHFLTFFLADARKRSQGFGDHAFIVARLPERCSAQGWVGGPHRVVSHPGRAAKWRVCVLDMCLNDHIAPRCLLNFLRTLRQFDFGIPADTCLRSKFAVIADDDSNTANRSIYAFQFKRKEMVIGFVKALKSSFVEFANDLRAHRDSLFDQGHEIDELGSQRSCWTYMRAYHVLELYFDL